MNNKLRRVLIAVLSVVLLVSTFMAVTRLFDYREGSNAYSEAEQLAGLPDFDGISPPPSSAGAGGGAVPSAPNPSGDPSESSAPYTDPYASALSSMDFTFLREVNGDVLGWIMIPGTRVSYPLVQTGDNEYYLNHTWKKTRSAVGSIFVECQSSGDLTDFNTIIYGHRMADSSMFHTLASYDRLDFWQDHPCVYITDDYGAHVYQIFAAYETEASGEAYLLGSPGGGARQEFIDFCLESSVIDTGVVPTAQDYILTLSTCTPANGSTRWVVQAVLRDGTPPGGLTVQPAAEPEPSAPGEGSQDAQPSASADAPASQPPQTGPGTEPGPGETPASSPQPEPEPSQQWSR